MTLDERVELLLEQLLYCDFRTSDGIDKARTLIRRHDKTQDKITRHACAEEVISTTMLLPGEDTVGHFIFKERPIVEFRNKAHAAIMNCRGGVE